MAGQPAVHGGQVLIGIGLLPAGIGKKDQVDGDTPFVHPHQHGGGIRLMESFP